MTWDKVDWDLWWNELVFMFLSNGQVLPDQEHCSWHWRCGYGPAQTYYKLMVDKTWGEDSEDGDV